jgi:hypothetical protein
MNLSTPTERNTMDKQTFDSKLSALNVSYLKGELTEGEWKADVNALRIEREVQRAEASEGRANPTTRPFTDSSYGLIDNPTTPTDTPINNVTSMRPDGSTYHHWPREN